jgi:hypothetical protein
MGEYIRKEDGYQKFVTGFRPIVHARQSLMLGIRQPLDGPVFQKKLQDAEHCKVPCKKPRGAIRRKERIGVSCAGSL